MKMLAIIPLSLVLVAAVGVAGCKALGRATHANEMLGALGLVLVASALAVLPAQLQRHKLQTAAMFQASFIGTVVHLGLILVSGIALSLLKLASTAFILWLLAGYWASLAAISMVFVNLIRRAPRPANN